jgi:hypothetical protein
MAATASLRVIKQGTFKGGTRRWSNRYHFDGGAPADATHWTTLSDAVVNAEKASLNGSQTIVETIGYAAGSEVPVFTKVYSTAGTNAGTTGHISVPLEVAGLVRYSTAARSTKNHPIYLFNYVHGALVHDGVGGQDVLDATWKSALQTYATAWITGFSDGTVTHHRASPNGSLATGSIVEEYTTHRDFPYQSSV